jgi:DNA (cytosine-5)-methyltransferase 1
VYAHGASQKNEDLFFEFVRLRDAVRPRVFVAENVSGLVKGVAKGYFLKILAELKRGYRVEARLLDAQWLGVPQTRTRVIFVGVRDDLGLDPVFPAPLPWRHSLREALAGLPPGSAVEPESDISRFAIGEQYDRLNPGQQSDKYFNLIRPSLDEPCPTIMSSSGNVASLAAVVHPTEKRKFSIAELKRVCAFPPDFVLKGTYGERYERLGNSVPPPMMKACAEIIRDRILIPDSLRTPKRRSPAAAKTGGRAGRSTDRSKTG